MDINNNLSQAQAQLNGGQAQPAQQPQASPTDLLMAQAQMAGTKKELSLKNLKQKEKEKLVRIIDKCKEIADQHYKDVVEPEIQHREDNYFSSVRMYERKFPTLSESSQWRSMDIMNVVKWITPELMEVFAGTNDPVDIKGVDVNDDLTARKIKELLKYQLLKKNNWFNFLESILKPCIVDNFGIAKVYWKHEEDREPYEMMLDTADMTVFQNISMAIQEGEIEITGMEPLNDGEGRFYRLTFDRIITKANHPVIEYLPASEFRFTPEAKSIQECKFVAHRKIVQGDYLFRKQDEGIYQNVKEALESVGNTTPTQSEITHNEKLNHIRDRLYDNDDASRNVELYECYVQLDYNNDGKLENLIVHCVGNVLLSVQENKPGIVPFFVAQAVKDSTMIFDPNVSYLQELEQMQDLKTALIRQVIINIALANRPQKIVKENAIDMDALMAGDEILVTKSGENPAEAIYIPPVNPLSPVTMDLVQYAQNDIEANSGSTRYNQGMDSQSLNKTATGIKAIMGASNQQKKLLARRIAENFVTPVFKYLIILNQEYMRPKEVFRLLNQNVSIRREEMDIDYDLNVDIGGGPGTKEAQIQYLMLLIQQLYPVLEQRGIVDGSGWHHVAKDLLDELGLKGTAGYLIDPDTPEGQQKIQAAQQAIAQKEQEAHQRELEKIQAKGKIDIEKAKIPKLGIYYSELPVDTQRQLLDEFDLKTNISQLEKEKQSEREYRAKRYGIFNRQG